MKLALRRIAVASPGAENARQSWPERHSLLVRLSDSEGKTGTGEASPLPGYSLDSLDEAEAALRAVDVVDIATALEAPSALAALHESGKLVSDRAPSARMALETAALDLLGQRQQRSAPSLLGASEQATRPLAKLLGLAASPALLPQAEAAWAAGFRHFKLKLGAPQALAEELEGVRTLRQRFGAELGLRLDANGCLSAAQVEMAWRALAPLEIELFEEPGAIPTPLSGALPLGLDESLQGLSVRQVSEQLGTSRARCLVLKPMALGGIAHCLELAEVAFAAGAEVVISHCFDGPFAWRAAAALALSLPARLAHGLAPHGGLASSSARPLPVERGVLGTWTEAGLGLDRAEVWV